MAEKGLGRGLDALFGETGVTRPESGVLLVPLAKIEPNVSQPRAVFDEASLQELAESIGRHGLINPIAVRRMTGGGYQIIAGERRWRACRMAGLSEVPVVVIEADDRRMLELAMIENLQRENLNPLEEAEGYRALTQDFGLTQEEAARRVGKSRPAVANALRLLALPDPVKALVTSGELSGGHARTLLPLADEAKMLAAAKKVIAENLSVRETEQLVKRMTGGQEAEAKSASKPVDYAKELSRELTGALGRRVTVFHGKKKGKILLEYYSIDDLERLTGLLKEGANRRGPT